MLHFMRKHAKFFYVFFFLIIISFIFFYVGPIDKNQNPVVIEIGKEKVYLDEYWRAYDNLRNIYRDIYKDKFTPEMEEKLALKEKTLEKLIEDRLLLRKAAEMGIYVSDEELQEAIMNEPAFQRDGVFNRNIYLRTLQLNRLTPSYYEAAKRSELVLKKIRLLIEDSVDLTPLDTSLFQGNQDFLKAIKASLLTDKQSKVLRSFVETLKKEYNVKVHSEFIS
ncbi:MAG: hypothetical protein D6710_08075 [Nitrospirae bacterium]|nr:MAG: hypothetical protein D6710_08075 [Nitrospirota bacterium]